MKKILLIFPPYKLEKRYGKNVGEVGGNLPPLGLCYIAAVLEKAGHNVKILDCSVNEYSIDDILTEIKNFEPNIIGLTAITALFSITKEISRQIKKVYPSKLLIIGGPHATIMPRQILKETRADIVISGEADETFLAISNKTSNYRKRGIIIGKMVKDLDKQPFPARHLLDMNKYTALPNNYKVTPFVFQIMTTRGCPFGCAFCASAHGIFRQRSVNSVISEIKQLIKEYGLKEVAFWDDIFTLNRKWIFDFCRQLKDNGINLAWSCETRVNLVDLEMLKVMKKAGCWNIFYGIEAGDQTLLNNINKKISLDQIRKAVNWTKKAGIEVRGSFMLGLPGETPELARKTIDFAIQLDPDYAQFSLTTPFPGTELFKNYRKYGRLNKDYDMYNVWSPVFIPKGYKSVQMLTAMHKKAFRRFYLRPSYVIKRILKLRTFNDIKRNIKGLRLIMGFTN